MGCTSGSSDNSDAHKSLGIIALGDQFYGMGTKRYSKESEIS